MKSRSLSSFLLAIAAPVAAVVFSLLVTAIVLLATGADPIKVVSTMIEFGLRDRALALTVNQATVYYLSAIAVAIGFRMNLFNIGVDGQYRLAAMLAAAFAGAVTLPPVLHVGLTLLIAMAVGAMWAGIAGLLKVYRGVSEVISTIMLNSIATALVAYLLSTDRLAVEVAGSNNIGTRPIPPSGQVPGFQIWPEPAKPVFGLILLAVLVGVLYWFILGRTRFGFDLRATGASASAAVASGVNIKRMTVIAMLISGATAGLVGMPQLLGDSYSYSLDFPAGLGFTGIAIALLGRNNAIGIAFGAFLFAFLDTASTRLQREGVSPDIVLVVQGVIVLSVVVAYEVVGRIAARREQQLVGRAAHVEPPSDTPVPAGIGGDAR